MPPQVGFKSLRLADSDSPEIPVQRVEQVVGFSRMTALGTTRSMPTAKASKEAHAMTYEMKPLSCNPAEIKGPSEKRVVSHYENNYSGAVKRLNAITAQL